MQSETKKRLQAMSNIEREKRLDELNRKLEVTQLNKSIESHLEETEEREWLKKKLGYTQY
jgi:ferritin-like metal-binding protein YciE